MGEIWVSGLGLCLGEMTTSLAPFARRHEGVLGNVQDCSTTQPYESCNQQTTGVEWLWSKSKTSRVRCKVLKYDGDKKLCQQ